MGQSLPFVMLTHLLVSLILLFLATTRVDNPLLLSSGSLLEKLFILEVIEFREDLSGISWSIFSCSEKSLTRRSQLMMMMKMKMKPPKKHQRRHFRTGQVGEDEDDEEEEEAAWKPEGTADATVDKE